MTTKAICISGTGTINSTNNPFSPSAPDSAIGNTAVYTVVSMPVLVYSWLDVDKPVDPARITRLFADLFLRGLVKGPLSARR